MSSLYTIGEQFLEAFSSIEVDENGEVLDLTPLDQINTAFDEKAENIALYIKNLSAMHTQIKTEEKSLSTRGKIIENKVSRLKGYLSGCMEQVGKDKLETPRCRISFRASTAVQIVNENSLPKEFVKITEERKPDKTALKQALQEGRTVKGVSLVKNRNIQIK